MPNLPGKTSAKSAKKATEKTTIKKTVPAKKVAKETTRSKSRKRLKKSSRNVPKKVSAKHSPKSTTAGRTPKTITTAAPKTPTPSIGAPKTGTRTNVMARNEWQFGDYFHHYIRREFLEDRLINEGDFIIRKSADNCLVISVITRGHIQNFQAQFTGEKFSLGNKEFTSFDDCLYYHYSTGEPIGTDIQQAVLLNPVKQREATFTASDVKVLGKLGSGAFGDVFKVLVRSLNNKECAMKTLKMDVDRISRENFIKEISMMIYMKHDNIVECLGTVEDQSHVKILMELVNKGSLDKFLLQKKLTERGKVRVLANIARGMEYVHRHNIIHRDLAARNILIHRNTDNTVSAKVSDFGLSRMDTSGHGYELKTTTKLPVRWMAPECFTERCWTSASDVWSFGVVVWEVCTNGKEPYSDMAMGADNNQLMKFIAQGGHPAGLPGINPNIANVKVTCWTSNRAQRPDMSTLAKILESVYVSLPQ